VQDRPNVGPDGIHLSVRRFPVAIGIGRLLVPLGFRQDVSDFIIRQAEHELDSARHHFAQWRRFHHGHIEVRAVGPLDSTVRNFRVNLARNAGNARLPDGYESRLRPELTPPDIAPVEKPEKARQKIAVVVQRNGE